MCGRRKIMPRAYPRRGESTEGSVAFPQGLRKDKINVLYCYSQVCHLAATAAVQFAEKGYPMMELDGGWRWWKDDGFDVEK